MTITLQPSLLKWARERASLSETELAKKLNTTEERVKNWEQDGKVTVARVKNLARYTYTPYGYLFLQEPPVEELPIPDFRTLNDKSLNKPSPNLLDTLYAMQQRQDWMREYLIEEGEEPKAFIGRFNLHSPIEEVATDIKTTLGLREGWAERVSSWVKALMLLREKVEGIGVLIVFNGVVDNNTHRKLDLSEFRGFALTDPYAPLVFINASDFKGAQMFTLAHELAHLWIGEEGVSNFEKMQPSSVKTELFCNKVAAEFLVPASELREIWPDAISSEEPFKSLAKKFKVSQIVAARRALDLGLIQSNEFFSFYDDYKNDESRKKQRAASGGDFWITYNVRVGRRFGQAVVFAAKSGRILYRDAYKLLGLKNGKSFDSYVKKLEVSGGQL